VSPMKLFIHAITLALFTLILSACVTDMSNFSPAAYPSSQRFTCYARNHKPHGRVFSATRAYRHSAKNAAYNKCWNKARWHRSCAVTKCRASGGSVHPSPVIKPIASSSYKCHYKGKGRRGAIFSATKRTKHKADNLAFKRCHNAGYRVCKFKGCSKIF
jgi:hypothetical protein